MLLTIYNEFTVLLTKKRYTNGKTKLICSVYAAKQMCTNCPKAFYIRWLPVARAINRRCEVMWFRFITKVRWLTDASLIIRGNAIIRRLSGWAMSSRAGKLHCSICISAIAGWFTSRGKWRTGRVPADRFQDILPWFSTWNCWGLPERFRRHYNAFAIW